MIRISNQVGVRSFVFKFDYKRYNLNKTPVFSTILLYHGIRVKTKSNNFPSSKQSPGSGSEYCTCEAAGKGWSEKVSKHSRSLTSR